MLNQNRLASATVNGTTTNPIGQRTGLTTSGTAFGTAPAYQWGYNTAGELIQADDTSAANNDRAYQFDGIGNRQKTANGLLGALPGTPNYTANALNQYTATPAATSLTYDADGNITSGPLPAHTGANSTLTWDAEHRLVSVTVNGTTTTYGYDHQSRRIRKTTGATVTRYLYDGWNPVAEYTGTPLQKSYTWGMDLSDSMQGAGGVGGLLTVELHTGANAGTYHPTYDGNGNISEYLDSTGATVAHYQYDPFGNTLVVTGSQKDHFAHRFSTKPLDAETGLYYYGYRYYDAAVGRWLNRDPIEERGGMNLYGFVQNDGVNRWDLLGMKEGDCCDKRGKPIDCEKLKKQLDQFDQLFRDLMDDWQKAVQENLDQAHFHKWTSFISKVGPGAIAGGVSLTGNAARGTVSTIATKPGMIPTGVSTGEGIKGIGTGAAETIKGAIKSRNVGAGLVGAEAAGQIAVQEGASRSSDTLNRVLAPFDEVTDTAIDMADETGEQFSQVAKSNRKLKNKFQNKFDKCCK